MKKQTLTVATLAIATFGWISVAAAQGPGGGPMRHGGGPGFGPGGPGGPPIERIAERLGLSDEQKAQWMAIHETARTTGEPLMKAAGAAKEAFDKALATDNADPAAIGQAAIAMKNARTQLEAHHKATMDAAKAILTPEQAAKFDEMQKNMGPQGQGMHKRRGPGELK
jgi:Spy/CpxP family protein refolding chaperone